MPRCAVLGSPIEHSLSPVLHRAAYAELGLSDWQYDAVGVAEDDLAAFLDGLDATWRGLSLTMPLKRTVVPLADSTDPWVRMSGVANTLVLSGERRLAFNTDIPGAKAALVERGLGDVGTAVVLGGGATATSVLLALAELGCREATLVVRDAERAVETLTTAAAHPHAPRLAVTTFGELAGVGAVDLVVSTVPATAQGAALLDATSTAGAVFEVVYDPWPTPLAQAALDSGRPLVGGLDLLVHQAVLQVQLMTGQSVGVQTLRDAGMAELRRRSAPIA